MERILIGKRCLRALAVACALALTTAAAHAHNDLLFPDGGEFFQPGETVTIQWTVTIEHTLVDWDVWYSTTGPLGPFVPIELGVAPGDPSVGSAHSLDWVVPDEAGASTFVRVRMNSPTAFWDSTSKLPFTIESALGTQECAGQVANSTGAASTLFLVGSDIASGNDLALCVTGLPSGVFGFAVNSDTPGFLAGPGGADGNLCLGGTIGRHVQQIVSSDAAGHVAVDLDLTSIPRGASSVAVMAGQTLRFQWWHRDANPMATSNFSDSRSLTFQ